MSEFFNWTSNFETGIGTVDDQHHQLVDLINRLSDLSSCDNVTQNELQTLEKELQDYVIYHFGEEEKMMAECKVDPRHIDVHVKAHHNFLQEVTLLFKEQNTEGADKAKTLVRFLVNWLAYHILGQDQKMAEQIAAIQSGIDPSSAYEEIEKNRKAKMEPLVRALDSLFELVAERNAQLKVLNNSLEEKVLMRTEQLAKANEQLAVLSLTDALTALPNRRHAMQCLNELWQTDSAEDPLLSCIMIDVDKFKIVNDTHGHDAGDEVLQQVAQTLKHTFRTDDIVCRLGGDEFFVICPHTDLEGALTIAEQARLAINALKVPTGDDYWFGSISLGVAERTRSMHESKELVKRADDAVYMAKEAGKNAVASVKAA